MDKDNLDDLKKDLKIIKLKIDELEQGLGSYNKTKNEEEVREKDEAVKKSLSLDERLDEMQNKIENAEKRIELLTERKKRIEAMKKEVEDKEAKAKKSDEKREAEKQRRMVEDERDLVEKEIEKKEEELKELKFQLQELNKFRFTKHSDDLDFKEDLSSTILLEEKQDLLWELQKINTKTDTLKKLMTDATSQKELIQAKLSEILAAEQATENEIKMFEEKLSEDAFKDDARNIEDARKKTEEKRRQIEERRWEAEDELEKIKSVHAELKAEYDILPGAVEDIKKKLVIINEKMDGKNPAD